MFFRKRSEASSQRAHRLSLKDVTLLDVRSPDEFAQGHMDGARNIPVQELGQRLNELDPTYPVAVYCRSGRRSATAAALLSASGFQRVTDLGGWHSDRTTC